MLLGGSWKEQIDHLLCEWELCELFYNLAEGTTPDDRHVFMMTGNVGARVRAQCLVTFFDQRPSPHPPGFQRLQK